MSNTNHEAAVIYLERYALVDIELADRKGELKLRSEAARALEIRSGDRLLNRARAGTGDILIRLGGKPKKGTRVESPAAV